MFTMKTLIGSCGRLTNNGNISTEKCVLALNISPLGGQSTVKYFYFSFLSLVYHYHLPYQTINDEEENLQSLI